MSNKLLITLLLSWLSTGLMAKDFFNADQHQLNVIEQGKQSQQPSLLLLSGPTDNWHSDLAWWLVGQKYLSDSYHTIALERAGQGFSPAIENPSYQHFAEDLKAFIQAQDHSLIIVAFASSNLSARLALQEPSVLQKVKGLILIDPDALSEHSIKHYTSQSENYRKNWQQLEQYIAAGKYQQRVDDKLKQEREHLENLLTPETEHLLDWAQYQAFEEQRSSSDYQINKFKEVTHYLQDLQQAKKASLPAQLPLLIIDSDFETGYLSAIEQQKEKQSIKQWRDESIEEFFALSQASDCGFYWPVASQEHLLMMSEPETIRRAVAKIMQCSPFKNDKY